MIKKLCLLTVFMTVFLGSLCYARTMDDVSLANKCFDLVSELIKVSKKQDITPGFCKDMLENAHEGVRLAGENITRKEYSEAKKTLDLIHSVLEITLKERFQCKEQSEIARISIDVAFVHEELNSIKR
jgi:hypothetical protein